MLWTARKLNEQRVMPDTQSPPPRLEDLSSARLFVGDAVVAFRLLNEARHRILSRVFGLTREHSNLISLFVIGAFVRGLERAAAAPGTQVRKVRSGPTAVGDTMIGVSAARETTNSIAGHPPRDTPFAAELIALAMTLYAFRAAIRRLLHAVRPLFRRLAAAAHTVRAVMRRWGISPSNAEVSPGANSRAVGEDRAHRGAFASG
jgi:hypothetical protein